ncbi:hypothetical protein PFICI_12518 [Pestalotiopsis fici W106-1]|uniref:NACHT domain-containing protein n=1 Tax=Pestalotiopsis fici (strain W106-1 / CGMCC3.15140) TaxID=1229662 RepID=W3WP46_PESFW|nr:uncharacterized protein PFICI_12518 [Pestalotiopsis fici W106-1]ETS75574.1 hypothetical protein PFICI_12518 [Pestalotiopsis fici W106-1]
MDTYVVVFTIIILFLVQNFLNRFRYVSATPSSVPTDDPTTTSSRPRPVRLDQINPLINKDTNIDLDVIAIHGFDARSPDTWTYKSTANEPGVNWLENPEMLPGVVGSARIFTCDWPSDFFESSDFVQKTFDKFAEGLLDGIESRPPAKGCTQAEGPPILFIASCLGGVMLMKALVEEGMKCNDSPTLKATRGIVFLATPFRGTAFADVAHWAEPSLRIWASLRAQAVSNLLGQIKEGSELTKLVGDFTRLCQRDGPFMATFFENEKSRLLRRVGSFRFSIFKEKKLLVPESSATLDIVRNRKPLNRTHGKMNNFRGPGDDDYKIVAESIKEMAKSIREGRLLHRAYEYINKRHYNDNRLKIVRISDDELSMSECYVNLAITYQPSRNNGSESKDPTSSSQSSLFRRLNVESPNKNSEVELLKLFDRRKDHAGREVGPRKILIRGQAGVGKTTLCKKMVYEFSRNEMWNNTFDRILWIPLRNLKLLEHHNLEALFLREFFSRETLDKGRMFATELHSQVSNGKDEKTLFILDGLDEVYDALERGHWLHDILEELLTMPASIVTSRPRVSLPGDLSKGFDLELETIGFYREQVDSYIEKVFTHSKVKGTKWDRVDGLRSVLRQHKLLQQLVRIPIQLDALCFIWDDDHRSLQSNFKLETMTNIYQAIMKILWKKDLLRLGQFGKELTRRDVQNYPLDKLEIFFQDEVACLEILAFKGMVDDSIVFTESQILAMPTLKPLKAGKLEGLSILRTHELLIPDPTYHFIHLTFQEYFAARYFVRQWISGDTLKRGKHELSSSASNFIKEYKYDDRYNVFWRFVTGLLSLKDHGLEEFFPTLETEPIDMIGVVHQRLLMHCWNEVSPDDTKFLAERQNFEDRLYRAAMEQFKLTDSVSVIEEVEFPEKPLLRVLRSFSDELRRTVLRSIMFRGMVPVTALRLIYSSLRDDLDCLERTGLLFSIRLAQSTILNDEILGIIKEQISYGNTVQVMAIAVLVDFLMSGDKTSILEKLKQQVTSLESESELVRAQFFLAMRSHRRRQEPQTIEFLVSQLQGTLKAHASQDETNLDLQENTSSIFTGWGMYPEASSIITLLGGQPSLPTDVLAIISTQLQNQDAQVRRAAVRSVKAHCPNEFILKTITPWLDGPQLHTREAVLEVLGSWHPLPSEVKKFIIAQLMHSDAMIRRAVIRPLQKWPNIDAEIFQAVGANLTDNDSITRKEAITLLGAQYLFRDEDIDLFKSILWYDQDLSVRQEALRVLWSRLDFNDIGFDLISECLQHPGLCSHALDEWQRRPELCRNACPEIMQLLLGSCLKSSNWENRAKTYEILTILHPSDGTYDSLFDVIMNGLKDPVPSVREAVARALNNWSSTEVRYLQIIIDHLQSVLFEKNAGEKYHGYLLRALENFPRPTDDAYLVLSRTLAYPWHHVCSAAVATLQKWPQPRKAVIENIVLYLQASDTKCVSKALEVLGEWSQLDPDNLRAIAKKLQDKERQLQLAAFNAVVKQQVLNLNVIMPYMESLFRISLRNSHTRRVCWLTEGEKNTVLIGSRALRWQNEQGRVDTWFLLEPGIIRRWRESCTDG